MADVRKTLDAQSMVKSALGADARISKVLPNGAAKVITKDPNTGADIEKEFDIPGMLKAQNVDPSSLNIKYNDETEPLDENALSFTDKIKMNFASSTKQQAQLLESQYGKNNVKPNPENDNEFIVKDADGVWKKAKTSIMSDIIGDIPETAGGIGGAIAGAKAGAAIGTLAGPVGTAAGAAIGGVIGGGLGTFIAKAGEIKAAEVLGIRTDEDLQTLGTELGKEAANDMIWSTVAGAGGKLAKNTIGKIADKQLLSNVFSSLVKGTKADDWMRVMRSDEAAKQIKSMMDSEIKWVGQKATGGYQALEESLSPLTKKTNDVMIEAISDFKKSAEVNFERGLKTLEDSGALRAAKMNIKDVYKSYGDKLVELGMATKVNEDSYQFLTNKAIEEGKDLVASAEGKKQLQGMFRKLEKIMKTSNGQLSDFNQFVDLKRSIQAVQENAGVFGSTQQNRQVVSVMKSLGADLINTSRKQLNEAGEIILKDGNKVKAGDYMGQLNKNYFNFREYNDALGDAISKADSTQDILKLAQNLADGKKMDLTDAFVKMGNYSGSAKAAQYLDQLTALKAAKNLSSSYAGDGIIGVTKQLTGMTPAALAPKVIAGSNIANTSANIAQKMAKYSGVAQVNNFVKSLSPTEMSQILTNKQLLEGLLNPIFTYGQTKESVEQALQGQLNGQQ